MNNNLVKIDIVDDKSLLKACDILHDGYCDFSTVKYDENAGTWRAIFEREFFEDTQLMSYEPKLLFFHKVTFPMVISEFTLEGIKTYKIEDRSKIQIYSFNECRVKNNIYTFFFNEGMEINITFKDIPKGKLIDQELLDKKGSYYELRSPFKKC